MKLKKVLIALLCIIFIIGPVTISYGKQAESTTIDGSEKTKKDIDLGEVISSGGDFIERGREGISVGDGEVETINTSNLKNTSAQIFNVLLTIGGVLTVGVGGFLGIKFMIASVEDKAKIKEMMIPYIAGCVIIFSAFAIWKITVDLLATM